MYMTFDQIQRQPEQIANFFHTFGLLTVGNVVSPDLAQGLITGYDKVTMARRGESLGDALQKGNIIEVGIVDEFPEFSNFYLSPNLRALYEVLLEKSWLYVGSDISVFPSYIQAWHRDATGYFPSIKVGYYANPTYKIGGEMRYIPGSHKIGDRYANNLQRGLAWPCPVTKLGGMNEHNFFPENGLVA
jgi:hypothetical protein